MLFKPALIDEIKAGRKTQTRRVVKANEMVWTRSGVDGSILEVTMSNKSCNRMKWRRGQDYAVCTGRGKKQVGRIKITSIRKERLQDISGSDARAEGIIVTPSELGSHSYAPAFYIGKFRRLWDTINTKIGIRWECNPDVWVLEFEYLG